MIEQFNSIGEVTTYLRDVEERLKKLEEENEKLHALQPSKENIDGNAIARYVASRLPATNLVNPSFLKRAFTVWGHLFVANLIIGVIIGIAYACLMMVLFGSLFGNLLQNSK